MCCRPARAWSSAAPSNEAKEPAHRERHPAGARSCRARGQPQGRRGRLSRRPRPSATAASLRAPICGHRRRGSRRARPGAADRRRGGADHRARPDARRRRDRRASAGRRLGGRSGDGAARHRPRPPRARCASSRTAPRRARAPTGSRSGSTTRTARSPDGVTAEATLRLSSVPSAEIPRSALTFSSEGELGVRLVDETDRRGLRARDARRGRARDESGSRDFPITPPSSCRARISSSRDSTSRRSPSRSPRVAEARPSRQSFLRTGARREAGARVWAESSTNAISHARLTLSVLVFLLLAGFMAYQNSPRRPSPTSRSRSSMSACISAESLPRIPSACCCGRWRRS